MPFFAWPLLSLRIAFNFRTRSKTRGHARHVINVFWLGYHLLYHEHLRDWFAGHWGKIIVARSNMEAVAEAEPLEALSNAWFFAGLFHDVGGPLEKLTEVNEYVNALVENFGSLTQYSGSSSIIQSSAMSEEIAHLTHDFKEPMIGYLNNSITASLSKNKPDQGVVAALHFRNVITKPAAACYAREGGRAALLHNMVPILNNSTEGLPVSWENEPIVCLLLLCDQLQTWDRERGDETIKNDLPVRAELSALKITKENSCPIITMCIDYIAPDHLRQAPDIYSQVKDNLTEILLNYPTKALKRISTPWPFSLKINCTLSGDPLDINMSFGT